LSDSLPKNFPGVNNPIPREIPGWSKWCLLHQPVTPRESTQYGSLIPSNEVQNLLSDYEKLESWDAQPATLVCAWYSRALSDDELTKRARKWIEEHLKFDNVERGVRALCELLEHLGEKVDGPAR
jgi:hypothetical protein